MTDQDFEQQLAHRLRIDAQHGVRPYDAIEVARAAMWAGHAVRRERRRRGGVPAWFRPLLLTGLLAVLLVAAAFAGGLIRLPTVTVLPTPSPTTGAVVSPSPSPLLPPTLMPTLPPTQEPTVGPSPSPDGSAGPSPSPDPSPSPSPDVSPSPSPEPSPSASPTPVAGWLDVQGFPTGRRLDLFDVAHGQGGFVIVGRGGNGGRSWFSADGRSWTRSTDLAFTGAQHVAAMGGQYYAIDNAGAQIGTKGVWRSADGLNWTLLTSSSGLGFVNDLIAENGVLIAVGSDDGFDEAMIWVSADGVSWTSQDAPQGTSELSHVAARGGDIAVIGDGGGGHGRRLFFKATHASEWQGIDPFGEDQDGRLLSIASNGGSFVAVGYWDDWDSGRRRGVSFSSVDGSSWIRTDVSDRDSLVFDQVVALPDSRYLAVASQSYFVVGECQPVACVYFEEDAFAYLSTNGTSWTGGSQIYHRYEEWPSEGGDQVEHPRAVAAGAQGTVIVDGGWISRPHVFFAPPGEY